MILTQSQFIFTDGFCGYLSNLSLTGRSVTQSLSRNLDLRDASASKNTLYIVLNVFRCCYLNRWSSLIKLQPLEVHLPAEKVSRQACVSTAPLKVQRIGQLWKNMLVD